MFNTFLATWTKLRRPSLLWSTYAAVAGLAVLFTTLLFVNATETVPAATDGPPGAAATIDSLSSANGLLAGLTSSLTLLGIIALCVAAAAVASEYSSGTLRNLLIRQPGRLGLLSGMWAAVVSFTVGAVLVAAVFAGGTALVLHGGQGVDSSAWLTTDGWLTSLRSLGEVALAAAGYATLGAALGVLLRSSVAAIAVGVAWLLAIENILAATLDGIDRWLPGQLLTAIASNGTATITLATAMVTAAAYLAVAAGAAGTMFVRRDVTA